MAEREFMGGQKSKMWTYLIFLMLLVIGIIAFNAVWNNPARAEHGVKSFLGLPGWALAVVTFLFGAIVFWFGLKVETDWPEAVGAFLIAASVAAAEVMIGWKHFALGLGVLPYLWPVITFVILLMYGMRRSA